MPDSTDYTADDRAGHSRNLSVGSINRRRFIDVFIRQAVLSIGHLRSTGRSRPYVDSDVNAVAAFSHVTLLIHMLVVARAQTTSMT